VGEEVWVLWPLCVLVYISAVVVDGACVNDCRGLGVCTVGTVIVNGCNCVGWRSSVVAGWGRIGRGKGR
jgi:hypothetical protein